MQINLIDMFIVTDQKSTIQAPIITRTISQDLIIFKSEIQNFNAPTTEEHIVQKRNKNLAVKDKIIRNLITQPTDGQEG